MQIQNHYPSRPDPVCGVRDFSGWLDQALHEALQRSRGDSLAQSQEATSRVDLYQYTPYLYSRWVRDLFWPLFRSFIRRSFWAQETSLKRVIFFHELYYPVSWSLRGLYFGVTQWLKFCILVHLADQSVFSTPQFAEQAKREFPHLAKRFDWCPVGSNIPVQSTTEPPSLTSTLVLAHFGGRHPTHLYDFVFAAFDQIRKALPSRSVELRLIGVDANDFGRSGLPDGVQALGVLSKEEVSHQLKSAHWILAPFLDGVTTRRGSLLAGLAHGRPVITTFGPACIGDVPWKAALLGVSMQEPNAKSQYAVSAAQGVQCSEAEWRQHSKNAETFYQEYFSWKSIAERLLTLLSQSKS